MSIQYKSITELNELLDNKVISVLELTQESIQLAKKYFKIILQDLQKSKPDKLDPNLAATGSNISLAYIKNNCTTITQTNSACRGWCDKQDFPRLTFTG